MLFEIVPFWNYQLWLPINRQTHLVVDYHEHSFGIQMRLHLGQFCGPYVLKLAIGIVSQIPSEIQLLLYLWRHRRCAYTTFTFNADQERQDGSVVVVGHHSDMGSPTTTLTSPSARSRVSET